MPSITASGAVSGRMQSRQLCASSPYGGRASGKPPRSGTAAFFQTAGQQLAAGGRHSCGHRQPAKMMPVSVPKLPYRTRRGGWQWVDLWNIFYAERIIFLAKPIDTALGNELIGTMLYLDANERGKPMQVYINSSGGEVVPSLALNDTFKHVSNDVYTVAFGQAMGMAGFLLACGKAGQRYALLHTRIMLQHPTGRAGGQAADVHNEGRELLRLRDYMDATLSVATGRSFQALRWDLERVLYMSAADARDYGVIDHVIKLNPASVAPPPRRPETEKALKLLKEYQSPGLEADMAPWTRSTEY